MWLFYRKKFLKLNFSLILWNILIFPIPVGSIKKILFKFSPLKLYFFLVFMVCGLLEVLYFLDFWFFVLFIYLFIFWWGEIKLIDPKCFVSHFVQQSELNGPIFQTCDLKRNKQREVIEWNNIVYSKNRFNAEREIAEYYAEVSMLRWSSMACIYYFTPGPNFIELLSTWFCKQISLLSSIKQTTSQNVYILYKSLAAKQIFLVSNFLC